MIAASLANSILWHRALLNEDEEHNTLLSYLATTTGWSDSFRYAGRIASGMLVGFKSESRSVSRRIAGRMHPEYELSFRVIDLDFAFLDVEARYLKD